MKGFKKCTVCDFTWPDREGFLADRALTVIGYQADFTRPGNGLILFNHGCGTTLSLPVRFFAGLHDGPRFTQVLTGTESCEGRCLHEKDLDPCSAHCRFAYARELLQVIRNWPKGA